MRENELRKEYFTEDNAYWRARKRLAETLFTEEDASPQRVPPAPLRAYHLKEFLVWCPKKLRPDKLLQEPLCSDNQPDTTQENKPPPALLPRGATSLATLGKDGRLYCAACWRLDSFSRSQAYLAQFIYSPAELPQHAECSACGMELPPDEETLRRWCIAEHLILAAGASLSVEVAFGTAFTHEDIPEELRRDMLFAARVLLRSTLPGHELESEKDLPVSIR